MTAFAAILRRDGGRPDPEGTARVGHRLARFSSRSVSSSVAGSCALLLAPLHGPDPQTPVRDRRSGAAAVGQVMLEDPTGLARALRTPHASDLELVVAAFGRWRGRLAEHLSGEFAFALWDPLEGTLVCARDGLGVRPLFIGESEHELIVSNALTAILAHPAVSQRLDEHALVGYLATGYLPAGRSGYCAVEPLPAGHTVTFHRDSRPTLERHWWFPQQTPIAPRSHEEILREYRATLQSAVGDRIRTGRASILLSGGLDSTTIAAAGRAAAPGAVLNAFTAVYARVPAALDVLAARAAAAALSMPLAVVAADAYEPLHGCWHGPSIPAPLDEPCLSDWRTLVAAAAGHSTVVLYGEDGDSLFLPPGLRGLRRASPPAALAAAIWRYARAERRLPYLGLRLRERLTGRRQQVQPEPPWLTGNAQRLRAVAPEPRWRPDPLPGHRTRPRTQDRLVWGVSEYLSRLVAPELTQQAAEFRMPLLDTRVIAFVVNIPAIPWCQRKRLPREAYRGVLPDLVLQRPKAGVPDLDRELTRSWQRRHLSPPALAPPLEEWVEPQQWRTHLRSSDVARVAAAWRVIQLQAWLERRTADLRMQDTCTP